MVFGRINHQYFTKPARPAQPPTLIGTGNEYQLKWSNVLWLGVKAGTSDERLPDDKLIISAVYIKLILVVRLWVFVAYV